MLQYKKSFLVHITTFAVSKEISLASLTDLLLCLLPWHTFDCNWSDSTVSLVCHVSYCHDITVCLNNTSVQCCQLIFSGSC